MIEDNTTNTSFSEENAVEEALSQEIKEPEIEEKDSPRIALTLKQAALALGKSQRALERSLTGKWGNKLPEGWEARKVRIYGQEEEWRIVPPAGFKYQFANELANDTDMMSETALEQLLHRNEFVNQPRIVTRRLEQESDDRHTIVIDRSDEVEYLLREMVASQKALAEERRLHMEDLRLLHQLQGSMRLLETNSTEAAKLKESLIDAQKELLVLKKQYLEFMALPWWKRLFKRNPST